MSVSLNKRTTLYHETGAGQSPREEVTYELGATIDGEFVPFTTLTANHVDGLVAASKAAKAAEAEAKKTT